MQQIIEPVNEIVIPKWLDRHLHVRDGDMMKIVLPCTLNQSATGAVIMGNLPEPISTIERAVAYRERIMSCLPDGSDFNPRMTLYLTDEISPYEVLKGFKEGAWSAVKLYMANQQGKGGTTGSAHGVKNLLGRYSVFEVMAKYKIPLLGHFEAVESDVDEFDREIVSFERDAMPLLRNFHDMPIVFEHITDGRVAEAIDDGFYNFYATVTPHHLMLNRNALFEGGMNPGAWCKPVLKREEHRKKICEIVTSGNSHFGAGTDSAPHDESKKSQCYGCAAGIFSAPSAVEMYADIFDQHNALQHLGPFLSENFLHLYGMEVSKEMMTIRRTPQTLSQKVGPVQVFMGGKEIPWTLVG